MKTETGLKLF